MSDAVLTADGGPTSSARSIWTLIGVETLCFLGTEIARFGVSVWIYQATQSVYAFAMLVLANTVPGMLISPLAGSVVDRFSRKRVMIGAATVALCGTLIVLWGASFGHLSMGVIAAGAVLASLGEAFQWPALSATIPLMSSEEDLPRYNGFLESGRATSMLAGPIIGGILFGVLKLSGLLAVEVTTFTIATLVVSFLHIPRPVKAEPDAEPVSLVEDSLYGLRFIYRHKPLLKFLLVSVFANFFLSIGIVLMPPYGLSFLSETTYGIANGLFGGGMIVGGVAYAFLNKRFTHIQLFLGTALIMGAIYSVYGFARGLVFLALLNFLLAMLMTLGNTAIITIWQTKVPEEHAGRVLSAMSMIAYSTGPISYLLAGPLSEELVPWLFKRDDGFAHFLLGLWGPAKAGELGFLFSAMGAVLFVGFAVASRIDDVRKVEEHPV